MLFRPAVDGQPQAHRLLADTAGTFNDVGTPPDPPLQSFGSAHHVGIPAHSTHDGAQLPLTAAEVHVEQIDLEKVRREDFEIVEYLKATHPDLFLSYISAAVTYASTRLNILNKYHFR